MNPHQDSEVLIHVLDEIACGVIILDAQARLIHSNLAGQQVLKKEQVLRLSQDRVQAAHSDDSDKLLQALRKALEGKRSMLTLGAAPHCSVALVPLDRHPSAHDGHSAPARVALIFSRTGMCEALMMSFFARSYQLTRSEEQVLSLMCAGLTAPEMAQQLKVGEATVRTHIRNICAKTHSNGIREVVKRLALLPPLMAAVMPSAFA